jgi:hypothetical protein
MSPEERWLHEILAVAHAQSGEDGGVGEDLQALVEVAEVLARMLALTMFRDRPVLTTVTATLNHDRPNVGGLLSARPAMAPAFIGELATRELDTRIEVLDGEDRLVGDVRFVWVAGDS